MPVHMKSPMLEASEAIAQSRLHTGFLVSAARYPDRVALSIGQQQWTYAQIDELARRWAAQLIVVTGGQPARIGVLGYKSLTSYVGILASLFAGATYVPLNPNYPVLRTRVMAQQADLNALIIDERSIPQLPAILLGQQNSPVILAPMTAIDVVPSVASTVYGEREIGSMKPVSEIPPVTAASIAYLLFTSGSTGKPNGVPITHANVCSFLRINSQRYEINQDDILIQIFDHTFDLSMFDIFMAWSNGAAISAPEPLELLAPSRYVAERRISVWFSVPSLAAVVLNKRFLKPGSLPGLRFSLFCGEALPRKIAEAWQAVAPNSIVENLYGPTELTICCAAYRWNAAQSFQECVNEIVPIGQIYSGLDYVIVDDQLRLVSPGNVGELCVAGSQTFPGYWRDPARTCARFFNRTDERGRTLSYYRTGDLVRCLDGGDLAFIGRVDHQIKVRGYRIDPGDIEAVLTRQPGVDHAVALGWPVESESSHRIVAFVAGSLEDPTSLYDALRQELPAYMIPSGIHVISSMPLNSNGKVDRHGLRARLGSAV
jgi:amino acid adenylation domain-containing protein